MAFGALNSDALFNVCLGWFTLRALLKFRKMITVDCGMNGLLSGFHFEFSEGGRWARSKYTCSKAGGVTHAIAVTTMKPFKRLGQGSIIICLVGWWCSRGDGAVHLG